MARRITISNKQFTFKMICILILWAIPLNVHADINTNTPQQSMDSSYWLTQLKELEDLYTKHPDDPKVMEALANAYNNYGVLLAQNQRWNEAVGYVQQALVINPTTAIRNNLSNIYYEQGLAIYKQTTDSRTDKQNAKQLANQALEQNPNNVHAYLLLGDIEYMSQNMYAAERAWQKAAQLLPGNVEVQNRLAQIKRETNAETDMNTLFHPKFNIKIDADVSANSNFNINYILDNAYNKVTPDFNVSVQEQIPVVVYKKQEYQETMTGAPDWSEAAYDTKIRLAIKPDQKNFNQLASDVIHEYTHVLVAKIAKGKCPRWFNEGIAKYEEYKHGIPPRIYMLAIAYNTDQIIPWDNINEALVSRNKQQALIAYQQSFSFVFFLVQRYGMSKIIETLKLLGADVAFDAAISEVYGQELTALQRNWRLWLTDFIINWANVPATSGVDYD